MIEILTIQEALKDLPKGQAYYLGSRNELPENIRTQLTTLDPFEGSNLEAVKDFVVNMDAVLQNKYGTLSYTASANRYLTSICDQVSKARALVNLLLGKKSKEFIVVDSEQDARIFTEFLQSNGFLVVCKSTQNRFLFALLKELKCYLTLFKMLWKNYFKICTIFSKKMVKFPKINIVTWVNDSIVNRDVLYNNNRYFGNIPDFLDRVENINFIGQVSYGNPAYPDIARNVMEQGLPIFLILKLMKFQDVLYAFKESLMFILRRKSNIVFQGVNYEVFVRESLKKDFLNGTLMHSIIQYRLFNRAFKFLPADAIVIYPFENQPWEKAMLLAASELKLKTRFVAYQFFPIAKNFLIADFSKYSKIQRNTPALFLTSDVVSNNKLFNEGFNTIQIGSCRYDTLLKGKTPDFLIKNEFVALCCLFLDSLEAISLATEAIRITKDATVPLWINCHPLLSPDVKNNIKQLVENNTHVTLYDCPVADLIDDVSVVLYNSSTVCYDAALKGIPIVYVTCQNIPNLDRFPHFGIQDMIIRDEIELISNFLLDGDLYQQYARKVYEIAKLNLLPLETKLVEKILL